MSSDSRYRAVVVGASLGGQEALRVVLHGLRTELPVPVVVAQHLGPAISRLDQSLGQGSPMAVRWAADGAPATPGVVYLCPSRSLVRLEPDDTFTVQPSKASASFGMVDFLFSSTAASLGPAVLAIVLTGAGNDGAAGAQAVREAGGTVVAQDPGTAVAPGMPGGVAAAGLADLVLPLPEIADLLDRVVGRNKPLPLPGVVTAEAIFAAGGAMGALMAATDWSRSPLGPVEQWSPVLRHSLAVALASGMPMMVLWGRDGIQPYNDAYVEIAGAKHPDALGRPILVTWTDAAEQVREPLERVWATGRAVVDHQRRWVAERSGGREEMFATTSLSPLRDGAEIVGVLLAQMEVADQVRGERRLRLLHRLATLAIDEAGEQSVCDRVVEVLADAPADLPFVLLYLVDGTGMALNLAGVVGVEAGGAVSPRRLTLGEASVWPVSASIRAKGAVVVDDLRTRLPGLSGAWPAPPETAWVMPAGRRLTGIPAVVVVAGISPLVPMDGSYRSFLEQVGDQVGASVLAARRRRADRNRLVALAALDREKTEFFAGVSHELRTPLTLTLGSIEELLDAAWALRPEHLEAARLAHRNALRLLKLVDTLLEFTHLEARRAAPELVDVDLAAITADVAGEFGPVIERAGLELIVDCPPLGRSVPVDVDMWERMVLNLVSNALKHTFAGSITVSLRLQRSHAELEVADTGVGIDQAELSKLFTRFHRVRGARPAATRGRGSAWRSSTSWLTSTAGRSGSGARPGRAACSRSGCRCSRAEPPSRGRPRAIPRRARRLTGGPRSPTKRNCGWQAAPPCRPTSEAGRRRRRRSRAASRPSCWWTTTPTCATTWRACWPTATT
ncbi:MAG: ATP-binding protein [Actinomycetota bacterium]|nr:ATP-binding protein [Actinomycetota bacterium]